MSKDRITVSKFVEGFERLTTDELKSKYVKKHITTTYAPILSKLNILQLMNEKSVVKGDIEYINLTLSKINLIMGVLALYTDITPDKDEEGKSKGFDAYDKLKSSGALTYIYDGIGSDLDELVSVQGQVMDTWHNANCSIEAFIAKQVNRFAGLFGGLTGATVEKLINIVSDEDKMNKIIPLAEKMLNK